MANLDQLAAHHAQEIIKAAGTGSDVENVLTKTLGVVQEQGVYAGMLYLLSRPEREQRIADAVRDYLVALLAADDLQAFDLAYGGNSRDDQTLLGHFSETVSNAPLQTLLLVKQLYEQTLTYARYSAKAGG